MTTRAIYARTYDSKEYQITDEDVLWMAVALWGEKHANTTSETEASAILWAWLNRLMLNANGFSAWGSLAVTIKNHSQPVSPKWRLGGKKCPVATASGDCSADRLSWREKMAGVLEAEAWDKIPPAMLAFADRMGNGELPQLADPTNVDFASNWVAKTYGKQVAGGEWFMNTTQCDQANMGMKWLPGTVYVKGKGVDWGALGLAGAAILWLGGLGWFAWRMLKG